MVVLYWFVGISDCHICLYARYPRRLSSPYWLILNISFSLPNAMLFPEDYPLMVIDALRDFTLVAVPVFAINELAEFGVIWFS
jgi:hypothetical protein